jgi:hypothetical protein
MTAALIAETHDLHRVPPLIERRQLARQVFDVHARAAVDVGRVFVRENADSHDSSPVPAVRRSIVMDPTVEQRTCGS